ncbi:hypothetical protein [endosymbiont of Lamellibrachia barhami]|uniref:hypothetical protein n=1 Tax=endosymbiont of Lamellibrachia barhami TaxID=205975 RepID=UPI001FE39DF4|nr:hypothetical protein [endosymbiont of Lamellibrachia barhami]
MLILATGSWVLFSVFDGEVKTSVWFMTVVGALMAAIFVFIYALPYRRMGEALQVGALPKAGEAMALIRRLIGTNLILGLLVTVTAVAGKYMGF